MNDLQRDDWHRETVEEAAEIRAKAYTAQSDKRGVHCDISERRWCGPLAEEVFHRWLEERGIWHEWQHDPDVYESYDFYIPPWYIDVKCIAATTEPLPHYGCNVKKAQITNVAVNAYVFARYLWPEKEMILFGAISKGDFRTDPVEREVGELVNKMTVQEPFLEQQISFLTSMEIFMAGKPCVDCAHWNGYMEGQRCGRCWMVWNKAQREAMAV